MWPDVIGVSVVFLISGMFMLGLENTENTKIFGGLMVGGMLGIVGQIAIVSWLKGTLNNFHLEAATAEPVDSKNQLHQMKVAISCALMCFVYPVENPKRIFGRLFKSKRFHGLLICTGIVLFFVIITTGCLTALVTNHTPTSEEEETFLAVPTFHVMEEHNLAKIIPAVACLLVLACSGALIELFPYKKIVELTTSDWRILAKQIGFENSDTGSPVLAVFICGSLCAMMAFACPLQNLVYILAGSHLLGIVFRSIYLLYIPFRPKIVVTSPDNTSSLNYSRLDSEAAGQAAGTVNDGSSATMTISTSIRRLWNLTRSETNPVNFPKKKKRKVHNNPLEQEEMEREWLLLGEPQSPRLDRAMNGEDDGIKSEGEIVDTRLSGEGSVINRLEEGTAEEDEVEDDSSSSTDIDAIVHEYMEKVRVTSGGPLEANVLRIPSASSWRLTLFLICFLLCAVCLLDLGIYQWSLPYLLTGLLSILIITLALVCTPKHVNQKQEEYQHVTISVVTLCASLILTVPTLSQSWPALLFWFTSGLALIIRCDLWCCPCLDKTEDVTIIQEPIFASTQQLNLTDGPPILVIAQALPKGHLIAR